MPHTRLFCFLLPFCAFGQPEKEIIIKDSLFVCYGNIDPHTVKGHGLLIIESEHYSKEDVAIFKQNNRKVIAYLSLTEVHETANHYEEISKYTMGQRPYWDGHYINISQTEAQIIVAKEAKRILEKGVDGLFLDNLDNVSQWGILNSMEKHLVDLIHRLRKENKDIYLMQNSGVFLLEALKNMTDSILIESVFTDYKFDTNSYAFRDKKSRLILVQNLKNTQKIQGIPIYFLEYADKHKMREELISELRKTQFPYFIANIDLQSVPTFQEN